MYGISDAAHSRLAMQAQAAYDAAADREIWLERVIGDELRDIEAHPGMPILNRIAEDLEGREALIELMERFS
ncbi:MAG: hypothetical protein GAK30_02975 [Paracidovorax wautersii]|uniref:Uncharacterized protein n=1 Tax=Paracidovorax wautersii TaxID=1177982 RepID=A0A7V8JPH1_9BURK|nr:MAG: hypothetical protein GAK30_02975 [Paracidovorax wautersii]